MDQAANRFEQIGSVTLVVANVNDTPPRGYVDRKVAIVCTREGCDAAPDDDCNECSVHRADSNARQRRYRLKHKPVWARKKLCLRCGDRRRKGSKWCSSCLIKAGKLKTQERNRPRNNEQRVTREVEGDGYARTRRHGQARRGQQPGWQLNEQDIDDAIERLNRAKALLEHERSEEVQALPRIQRQAVKNDAGGQIELAIRFAREVQERCGYKAK